MNGLTELRPPSVRHLLVRPSPGSLGQAESYSGSVSPIVGLSARLRGKPSSPVRPSGPGAPQVKLPGQLSSGLCITLGQKGTTRDTPRL